ncbi:glycosyltransferase family 39 protein [Clostridium sp. E02]|uniref:ArnT family glycosyltransferase n=1 Tax=Clostridium sp. E02 TaxID=2487134 RepID=UPI0013DE5F80|nr:glycosyltransferase family 39 protein [Clostridium sp. E02]
MKLEKNLFYRFCVALSVVGIGYILICGVSWVGGEQEYPYAMKGMLLSVFFLVWVGVHFLALLSARLGIARKLSEREKLMAGIEACYVILVLAAAFILRYAVILKFPMEPASDYKTYYEIAEMLKNGTLQDKGEGYCNYIAMFPHIIGYCYILKQVFVLFGTSVFHGQIANILFSVGTVFLIYRIGRRLGGRLAGVIALTAAAFWPSQIMYINMLAAEYAFSFFLYLSVLLFLHLAMDYDSTTKHAVIGILLHILLGFLIAISAAIRPMALILLIAILLCMLPLKMKLPGIPRNSLSIWVRFLGKGWLRGALILVSYMILSGILTTNIELVINQTVPSFSESFGYNLLVGLNTEANGGWNEEDSKFLYDNLDRTGSPIQAQIACRNQALLRLNSDPEAIFNLFINKYELLWGNDDYGATWNLAFLKEQNTLSPQRADILYRSQNANHIVYMVFVLFSFMTLIYLLQRKASYVYVLILMYLGTAGMHIFVESQNRYHFHVLPVIMIMTAVGIGYIFENSIVYVKASDHSRQEKEKIQGQKIEALKRFEEEELKAIENRYKSMTNAFDMQSAIKNGNVIVTVSEKYRNPSSVETDREEKGGEKENETSSVPNK